MLRPTVAVLVALTALASTGCSPKKMGISRMADALSSTASAFSRDDDPELVRLAAPSTLKMVEMLLDDNPSHAGLLMTACSGFTQYAYGFLQVDSEIAAPSDAALSRQLGARAIAMYARARGYCTRALQARHPGFAALFQRDPRAALASATAADVPALYWLGAAMGGSLSLAENPLMRLPELGVVRLILARALALNEQWESGAIHEVMIAVDGVSPLVGGSAARAKTHFDRAVALSNGESAFAYVTMATSVAQPAKDRREFERLLRAALAIDVSRRPSLRLANLIAQKRARFLLSRADRLF